ncbi:MAG TPA: hybrid sensor histidine kinase/response regulator [Polyangiaceae bacterium]|nr:hybrid sensor histidine kinase/response regulator [Polyangiaceae bacterium]HOD25002.1 hybrid sensor histidine kinase/response regulator [Polyangiaceae bacterium]HOE51219.1 hybrid sensor histidine kinase/response regulator [Polyangiaceae bacterium]HOG99958.1 hybrid sensor histidine kinase/response regulator [Polyangiaceae bacterium]HOR38075.1 hybrid sensor histidine kinase/response regulator [Polyangiaceae bacterium]
MDDKEPLALTRPTDEQTSAHLRIAKLEGALHDVANALTVVLGWLEAAEQPSTQDASVSRAIHWARERGLHGRAIALRAMGYGKEAPEQPAVCESIVADAVVGMEPEAKRKGIELFSHIDGEARLLGVTAPSSALQVLTNLLLNAIAFSPDGARVSLTVACLDTDTLRFVVTDEGPGIPPDRAGRVFDGLVSTRQGGTGIGLRHAHQLSRENGGRLSLLHPGPGAVFELCWPSAAAAQPRRRTPSVAGLEGMRVLVLEDDTAVSMLLETALGARGAVVDAAYDQEGMQVLLADNTYDAALVDLSPLEPDVARALGRIQERCHSSKLILITGSACRPEQAILDHAAAWVRKPFEIGDIVAALLESSP